MEQKPNILQVSTLFSTVKYEIPIYQRNYAWVERQIQQLIDDINSSEGIYFLGNLIVNQKEADVFEVIDGQQRLTTLYLLEVYLNMNVLKGSLYFEAREKSNRTLSLIGSDEANRVLDELQSDEINRGYKIIEGYFKSEKIDMEKFKKRLLDVQLVRIQVPDNIDLNHYFEVMNTRGEQLEFHEIAKAKLLSRLSTAEDKSLGALIWEVCSNMNSYVQMNFELYTRKKIFAEDWSNLVDGIWSFDSLKEQVAIENIYNSVSESRKLIDILENPKQESYNGLGKIEFEESERFESIISFPNFLLQVNKSISDSSENESMLDDKNFLENLEKNWQSESKSKKFLYNLLRCRVLFDKYIIKREFIRDYKEAGKWSLQRIESYKDKNGLKPKYIGTISDEKENKKLRVLQSCLRITYTSPKTMHWIGLILRKLMDGDIRYIDIRPVLEGYCNKKVEDSNYKMASGFDFERIVFTYLDYILYRDGYSYGGREIIGPLIDDWSFQFRNSIEHFYPQNPVDMVNSKIWESKDLNDFGNLALITTSGNSKFSNLPPEGKINSYPSIIDQSLKLRVMKEMIEINKGIWDESTSKEHREEMFKLFQFPKS